MTLELYGSEQRALGKYLGKIEQIRHWMQRSLSSPETEKKSDAETVAELLCITLTQFNSVVKAIEAHPDWDDEQFYEEVDWRRYR